MALHASGRATEGGGHVRFGPVGHVTQDDHLALTPGQAAQCPGDVDALGQVRLNQ